MLADTEIPIFAAFTIPHEEPGNSGSVVGKMPLCVGEVPLDMTVVNAYTLTFGGLLLLGGLAQSQGELIAARAVQGVPGAVPPPVSPSPAIRPGPTHAPPQQRPPRSAGHRRARDTTAIGLATAPQRPHPSDSAAAAALLPGIDILPAAAVPGPPSPTGSRSPHATPGHSRVSAFWSGT